MAIDRNDTMSDKFTDYSTGFTQIETIGVNTRNIKYLNKKTEDLVLQVDELNKNLIESIANINSDNSDFQSKVNQDIIDINNKVDNVVLSKFELKYVELTSSEVIDIMYEGNGIYRNELPLITLQYLGLYFNCIPQTFFFSNISNRQDFTVDIYLYPITQDTVLKDFDLRGGHIILKRDGYTIRNNKDTIVDDIKLIFLKQKVVVSEEME